LPVYNPEILLDAKLPNFNNLSAYYYLLFRKDSFLVASSLSYYLLSLIFQTSEKRVRVKKTIIYLSAYIQNVELNVKTSFFIRLCSRWCII